MVVICDDEDRENEGDLSSRRSSVRPRPSTSCRRTAAGSSAWRCRPSAATAAPDRRAANNEPLRDRVHGHVRGPRGHPTGISAYDRATRSRWRSTHDPAGDLVQPGHIFPLRAKPGGVLERTGHTEAPSTSPAWPASSRGRDLRGDERRRHDGPGAGPRAVLRAARPEDVHHRGPDRLPRRHEQLVEREVESNVPTDVRRVPPGRLPLAGRRQAPPGPGQGRCGRPEEDVLVRVHSRVPHRRRLPLDALRLRRAARVGAGP